MTTLTTTTSKAAVHPDLQREREQATFDTQVITHILDGGADRTARRRLLEQIIARDPTGIFDNTWNAHLTRQERHVRALAKHVRLVELCRKLGIGNDDTTTDGNIIDSPDWPLLLAAIADDLPTALHWIMFVPNIKSLCDEQQQKEWLPLCRDWKIMGCYAQTELGHGSNIRALETTATFLPESRGGHKGCGGSWIIHSPTLTSIKFWPGSLGKTANYAMVIANLVDGQGKNQGLHNFLVPLRDPRTHQLLPNIETGDIGPKIGYNNMDNGYARFHHVLIPRRNMAMRFATVNEQGVYKKLRVSDASSKVAYITMMYVRALIVQGASIALAQACVIAIRYAAVRRQGFDTATAATATTMTNQNANDIPREMQILDYQQQQHRLFPRLAASYAFFFCGQKLMQQLKSIEQKLTTGGGGSSSSSSSAAAAAAASVSKQQVTDLHASSSALKSYCTMFTADGMEDLRKSCGGHGFLYASGFPELVTTYLQNPTVEGDNFMLPQQVVKVLLKLVQAVQQQQKLQQPNSQEKTSSSSSSSLEDYKLCDSYAVLGPSLKAILGNKQEGFPCSSPEQVVDNVEALLQAFGHRAARLLVDCAHELQRKSTSDGGNAWNACLVQMGRTSKAYSQCLILRDFYQYGILQHSEDGASTTTPWGAPERHVLTDLLRLLALYWMEESLGDFLEDGYVTTQQADWIRRGVATCLLRVRPNAVALCDARDIPDFRLKSALGRYDGQVYQAIMESTEHEPLNKNTSKEGVGPGYAEHLKRLYVDGVGVYTGTASRL